MLASPARRLPRTAQVGLIRILPVTVSHPGKGECADPVNEDAILEGAGGRRPGRNRERQFDSDTRDGKT